MNWNKIREDESKILIFNFLDHGIGYLNQEEKENNVFQILFPNYLQKFKKMAEDGLAWQYQL